MFPLWRSVAVSPLVVAALLPVLNVGLVATVSRGVVNVLQATVRVGHLVGGKGGRREGGNGARGIKEEHGIAV